MIHLDQTFEQIADAVMRNDRIGLQREFVRLRLLQDHLHGKHVTRPAWGGDGIDWPIETCDACAWR